MTAHLLPGQAAAPEGPADLSMMYALHHGFRRDLARFHEAVLRTPLSQAGTWQALLERWDLFALLLHDHHHKEDEHLWPLLRGRVDASGDAEGARVLDAMEDEHARIDPLLEAVRSGFKSLAGGPSETGRHGLVADLEQVRELLGAHLGHEERDAIAILQRYVPGDEWARVERAKFRGGLGPRDLLRLVPWCLEGLPPQVASGLLTAAGPPFRVVLWLGRGRFHRLERAAFAFVPEGVGA
ncbi:hemerythrin domain-containing protein [Nocardioides sp. cx-173]|uniref:hemerythrin domain-containing protein n=1 Tax=Nocardioides sp. cx-173 TaxID=2898796 RepID=UPI001E2B939C|nr:hemerythrin domain-containing protein [Nocardioides sp. cx-173]MCD4527061.1 hemerythrin domain-containing protein [Nocardioides sp. cx-173]UGB42425.1 hemerythrin domain-containing protein [Nocardioides sp. cx-173]